MTTVFHRDFDAEIEAEVRAEAHARACRFTQEDLDAAVAAAAAAARAEGVREGHATGHAEALSTLAARRAETLDALAPQIAQMLEERLAHRAALESQMAAFALAVCEKIMPEFLATRSAEAAATEVRRAMGLALRSPVLRIRLAAEVRDLLAPEIEAMTADQLDPRQLDIAIDPALGPGEIRVSWQDGFMEYSFDRICQGILSALRASAAQQVQPIRKAM
ncbi:hypothetical protein FGG78_22860 [Thioclava sp. BHET1]|nr:hypothetical protein FGG78_22860 [Thioclava sp. BHET1]